MTGQEEEGVRECGWLGLYYDYRAIPCMVGIYIADPSSLTSPATPSHHPASSISVFSAMSSEEIGGILNCITKNLE